MPCTDRVEEATVGGDEGIHGGAAAEELRPAEPEAAVEEERWCNGQKPANTEGEEAAPEADTTKPLRFGIEVLEPVSMSEMSLSSKREAAAAQGLLLGLPMLNRWTPPAKEPTITMWVSPLMPKAVMSKTKLSNVWFSWRSVKWWTPQPVRNETRV